MIKADRLYKTFGKIQAVDDVSLHVEDKDIFGLVGPDGAGKTTLMRMICGLMTPSRGSVHILGKNLDKHDEIKSYLGYMPQKFSLYGDLTVMENIHFIASLYGLDNHTYKKRVEEILQITNLMPFKDRFADHLSGGMKQKLALTCALVTRPQILVLDEPTYGVDPESRKEFWRILYRLNQEGVTILVSTPYMDEADLCKKIAFINQGKIVGVDTPVNLKKKFAYKIFELSSELKAVKEIKKISGVIDAYFYGNKIHITVTEENFLKAALEEMMLTPFSIKEIPPSMEDVFVFMAEKR
ncbi:MAG: ABC transporter ATP-binding protein [Clostridia bacterium]|nr:ABC transporter ATP-binding protein [Clostridia bacterium]